MISNRYVYDGKLYIKDLESAFDEAYRFRFKKIQANQT